MPYEFKPVSREEYLKWFPEAAHTGQTQEEETTRRYWNRRWDILEDSIAVFLEEEEGFRFEPTGSILSEELYEIYCHWCRKEKVVPEGLRALSYRLKHNRNLYPVREATLSRKGKRLRGFYGIEAVTEDTDK